MAVIDIQKSASRFSQNTGGQGVSQSAIGPGMESERFPKVTLRLKSCERCGGDVTTGRDWHGDYLQCLQCGWYKDEPGDALSGLVEASMSSLMEEMERNHRSRRRAS